MLIGLFGNISAGKGTVGDILVENGFIQYSFAEKIKDIIAIMFDWDRELIEGRSEKSRIWRETIDDYWSESLEISDFTPRKAMQLVGTDIMRNHFHKNIWVMITKRKITEMLDQNNDVVITDARFANEIAMIKEMNGKIIKITRNGIGINNDVNMHYSETEWINEKPDYVIKNNGRIEDLRQEIHKLISKF